MDVRNIRSTAIKRCRLNSLSPDERWTIGMNELRHLRVRSKEISMQIYNKRLNTIVDFISGTSDRIDSDGVIVEFFVGPVES